MSNRNGGGNLVVEMGPATTSRGSSISGEVSRLSIDGTAAKRRTSLFIPQGMSIDAWRHLGRQIFIVTDASGWWLGDWLIYGQAQYPGRYKRAIAETSLDYQTLRNYAWVARQFTPARRRNKLSFQHHAEVASLTEAEQDKWLDEAERCSWSRNELRRQIKASRDPEHRTREVIHIQMNVIADQKRRWQEAAKSEELDLLAWMFNILDHAATRTLETRPGVA